MTFDDQMTQAASDALAGRLTWQPDPTDPAYYIIYRDGVDCTNTAQWLITDGLAGLDRDGTVQVIDVARCRLEAAGGGPL